MRAGPLDILAQIDGLPGDERRSLVAELYFMEQARAVAREMARELRGDDGDFVDDKGTPAPKRTFIGAIRRGELKGVRFGRRWVVQRDEHARWLQTLSERQSKGKLQREPSVTEELTRELRLAGGGR